jgi:hypothetical protein
MPLHRHADPVREPEQEGEADGGPGDQFDVAEHGRHDVPGQKPGQHDRQGGDQQHDGEARVRPAAKGYEPQRAGDYASDIAPEIDHNRQQGAHMDRDVDSDPLVFPAQDPRGQHQVSGRADRQELGQSLDHRQNKKMIKCHVFVSHP